MKTVISDIIYDMWLRNTSEGIIIISTNDFSVQYFNSRTLELLLEESKTINNITDILEEKEILSLMSDKKIEINNGIKVLEFQIVSQNEQTIIIIHDKTRYSDARKKNIKLKKLNGRLSDIYESLIEDYILVTDPDGKIEYISKKCNEVCGDEISNIHKNNIRELDFMGLFSSSAIFDAISTKQPKAVIQSIKTGETYVCFTTPILDKADNIIKIITISRAVSKWTEKGKLFYSDYVNTVHTEEELTFQKQILTCSENMVNAIILAKMASPTESTILINGETGTGKEVFAKYIHQRSLRADKPFIKINCGSLSNEIVESELFGYESGAFTDASKSGKVGLLEAANGGTLFLDEIGDLPINQQVKLLRALQEKEICRVGSTEPIHIDIRVISATNIDLKKQVGKGYFREDLFYRLNVISINIPPLRERPADISILSVHFLDIFNKLYNHNKKITNGALSKLRDYDWPGNVRELENTIERLVVSSDNSLIEVNNIPQHILERKNKIEANVRDVVTVNRIIPMDEALKITEDKLISMAFEKYGTGKKVAEALEVDPATISRKTRSNTAKE